MNWEELEREFVAEGFANGSLHPRIDSDPGSYWQRGRQAQGFGVGYDFHFNDWEALFLTALDAASPLAYVPGEDYIEYERRNRKRFENSLSGFPFLARIYDMYEDALFETGEMSSLREECIKARRLSTDQAAIKAANKLILLCKGDRRRNGANFDI